MEEEFADKIMSAACENLLRDRFLTPTLFLLYEDKYYTILGMEHFPETTEQRCIYLSIVRKKVQSDGKRIASALMLLDAWYAEATADNPDVLSIRPSQHPKRKSAIVLMGRNAEGTRQTFVVQPYTENGGLISVESPTQAVYGGEVSDGPRFEGIIDALFE